MFKIASAQEGRLADGTPVIRAVSTVNNDIKYQTTMTVSRSGVVTNEIEKIYTGKSSTPGRVVSRFIQPAKLAAVYALGANSGMYLEDEMTTKYKISVVTGVQNGPRSYSGERETDIRYNYYYGLSPETSSGRGVEQYNYPAGQILSNDYFNAIAMHWNFPQLDVSKPSYSMVYRNFSGEPEAPSLEITSPLDSTISLGSGTKIEGKWWDKDSTSVSLYYQIGSQFPVKVGLLENEDMNIKQPFSFNIQGDKLALGNNDIRILAVDDTGMSDTKVVKVKTLAAPNLDLTETVENLNPANKALEIYTVDDTVKLSVALGNNTTSSSLEKGVLTGNIYEGIGVAVSSIKINNKADSRVSYDATKRQIIYKMDKPFIAGEAMLLTYEGKILPEAHKKIILGTQVRVNGTALGSGYFKTAKGPDIAVIPTFPKKWVAQYQSYADGTVSSVIKAGEVLSYSSELTLTEGLYSEMADVTLDMILSDKLKYDGKSVIKINGAVVNPDKISYNTDSNKLTITTDKTLISASPQNKIAVTFEPTVTSEAAGDSYSVTSQFSYKNPKGVKENLASEMKVVNRLGVLEFQKVPSKIDFGTVDLPVFHQQYLPVADKFVIEIENSLKADWSLSVEATPLSSEDDIIPDAVRFVSENGREVALSDVAIEVASSKKYPGEYPVLEWNRGKGLLLDVPAGEVSKNSYKTIITWELKSAY